MIEAGRTYIARGQGTAITPQALQVTVVWVGDGDVWYRRQGSRPVDQTSPERFASIVGD